MMYLESANTAKSKIKHTKKDEQNATMGDVEEKVFDAIAPN